MLGVIDLCPTPILNPRNRKSISQNQKKIDFGKYKDLHLGIRVINVADWLVALPSAENVMIFKDNEKHHKPHVHVYYGEYEAAMSLDGEVLEGKLPLKQYRMISGWMALHENELYEAWNNAVREKPFAKIEPLK